jgi:hypothetical protein
VFSICSDKLKNIQDTPSNIIQTGLGQTKMRAVGSDGLGILRQLIELNALLLDRRC